MRDSYNYIPRIKKKNDKYIFNLPFRHLYSKIKLCLPIFFLIQFFSLNLSYFKIIKKYVKNLLYILLEIIILLLIYYYYN